MRTMSQMPGWKTTISPDLLPISNDSNYGSDCGDEPEDQLDIALEYVHLDSWADVLITRVAEVLSKCQPFPGDGSAADITYRYGDDLFVITE